MKKMIGAKLGWHVHAFDADSLFFSSGAGVSGRINERESCGSWLSIHSESLHPALRLFGVIEYGLWFR